MEEIKKREREIKQHMRMRNERASYKMQNEEKKRVNLKHAINVFAFDMVSMHSIKSFENMFRLSIIIMSG